MSAEVLLSRLDRVKQTGPNTWIACCKAHDDRGPSLSIRELEDGFVLLHCFAGCETSEVIASVGLQFEDLYPERIGGSEAHKPLRRPFPAGDVLRCTAFEALVVATSAAKVMNGTLTQLERDRLMTAVARLQSAARLAGVAA